MKGDWAELETKSGVSATTIQCLIIDASASMVDSLAVLLRDIPGTRIVGKTFQYSEAVARALETNPNVIALGLSIPEEGLHALRKIAQHTRVPIIAIHSHDCGAELAFKALHEGAIEALELPNKNDLIHFESHAQRVRDAFRAVAKLGMISTARPLQTPSFTAHSSKNARTILGIDDFPNYLTIPYCIGIVASTGGPAALKDILSPLPGDFPIPIVVVQHIAKGFSDGLVRFLISHCTVSVRLAKHGDELKAGVVLFAPDEQHMTVQNAKICLDSRPPIKSLRPSGNILLSSLAQEFKNKAAGFILTGMGDDGVSGLQHMKIAGAFTAAQSKRSSVVFGMPAVALRTGAASFCFELEDIPAILMRMANLLHAEKNLEKYSAKSVKKSFRYNPIG